MRSSLGHSLASTGREIDRCPVDNLPMRRSGAWHEGLAAEDMAKTRWIKPATVVQVAFVEWTDHGVLRHSSFAGIRDDK